MMVQHDAISTAPVVLSLPISDRITAFAFYRRVLAFAAVGDVADDGVPEPLQFVVNEGMRLMLVPRGGFGWVVGDNEVASAGSNECVIGLGVETAADVDRLIERASGAGGSVVTAPGVKPWGYTGTFADPDGHLWMITSVSQQP